MPANVVKTPEDEAHWAAAKAQVRKAYPDVAEGSDRFYALTMEIFRRMKFKTGGKPAPAPMAKAQFAALLRELLKAEKVVDKDVGSGKLSERTREQVGRSGSSHRDQLPEHVFLEPASRTYPVKVKRNGAWAYSAKLLLAAARRARMQGHEDIAKRADALRAKLQPDLSKAVAVDQVGRILIRRPAVIGRRTRLQGANVA